MECPTESDELVVPESEELVAPESQPLVSAESQEAEEFVTPESLPDSLEMEVVPDSITPEVPELAPDSSEMEVVPDSLPPSSFLCACCHLVHEDRQAWNRVHSRRWPCSRCGLVHAEYILSAMIDGFNEFDCEVYIPDLDNVVMDGNTLVLPPHVLKMLDEKRERERKLAAGNITLTQGDMLSP
jgi:hypothetical protein